MECLGRLEDILKLSNFKKECGRGQQSRTRTEMTEAAHGVVQCAGEATEKHPCNTYA